MNKHFKKYIPRMTKDNLVFIAVCGVLILAAGFWIGYDYRTEKFKKDFINAFSNGENAAPEIDSTETKEADTDIRKEFKTVYVDSDKVINFSKIAVRFNNAKSASVLTSEYGSPLTAKEGTKFIVVNHTVTNTTKNSFSYEGMELVDGKGRHFSASSDAIGTVDDYLNYKDLAPSVPETGVLVYIVPKDADNFEFGGRSGADDALYLYKIAVEQ